MVDFRSIRSRSHPLLRRVRALARSADRRRAEGVYLAEGVRWAEEALSVPRHLVAVLVSARLSQGERGLRLRERLGRLPCERYEVSDAIFDALGDARTPQGVLLLLRQPVATLAALGRIAGARPGSLCVVAVGVQDPGNLGGLVRTARALGASGFACHGGADLFHPRAVRASAGALLALPVAQASGLSELAEFLRGIEARAAVPRGGSDPGALDWSRPGALVLGSEAAGLPPEIEASCRGRVSLPMSPGCESLNVGAAAAALLALVRTASRP
jgi:TrmH family RNA methyltransferase